MSDVAAAIDKTRTMADRLIEYAARKRMIAYRDIADDIGVSVSWLRQFIGRNPGVGLSFATAIRIRDAYDRLCERIEAAQETERARLDALRREMDAIVPGYLGMVDRLAPPAPGATDSEEHAPRGDSAS